MACRVPWHKSMLLNKVPARRSYVRHRHFKSELRSISLTGLQCTAGGSPHAINSRKGIISFFNTGSGPFESENGMTDAQRFFETTRLGSRKFKI